MVTSSNHNVMSSNAETSQRDSLPRRQAGSATSRIRVISVGMTNVIRDHMLNWRHLCVLCVISLCPLWLSQTCAQIDAFANVRLNRTTVYPEQPIKATVTVYTATWFTKPLDFDNIQVPNSFVIPFKRTLSTMHEVRGKKYASLEFYYLIYPYESGQYQMPSIEIRIETPPQGDYKGQSATVRTNSVDFTVSEVPPEFQGKTWFVAKNVRLSQSWDRPLSDLKVGDVIERTVTIRADGTMPSFIPEIAFASEEFGSAYPKTGSLNDRRDEKDVNGTRVEKVVYLLEKEGNFEIPGVRIEWWNPYSQQLLFRELEAVPINIVDNPELGMVRTLKDSLALASGAAELAEAEDEPLLIFGMDPWKFLVAVALLIVAIRFILRELKESVEKAKRKKERWLNSEQYAFSQIRKNQNVAPKELINLVYHWWDKIRSESGTSLSIRESMASEGFNELFDMWTDLESNAFRSIESTGQFSQLFKELSKFRVFILSEERASGKLVSEVQLEWKD